LICLLAKFDENESKKLIKSILLDIFFCDENINLIENIDNLDEIIKMKYMKY
jgi:hypothetical protein